MTGDEADAPTSGVTDQWDAQVRAFALTATYGNEGHAVRWPETDWCAAAKAAAALRPAADASGAFAMVPNEVVPEWLREQISGRLTPRGDAPTPTICTLWIEHRNWFTLAQKHPNELALTGVTPDEWPEFDVDQFQAVWDNTRDAGAVPFMTIALLPKAGQNGPRFTAEIQAFYVVTPHGVPSVDEHASSILNISPCARSWLTPVSDAELLDAARGVLGDANLQACVTVWDWMCGTSDLLNPTAPSAARHT